jgi:O-antigen ligase
MIMLILLVITSGLMGEQIESAGRRLHSEQAEESALSRLPVAYAAIRMFEVRPIVGWGYGNFDLFDREFQARVGNLVSPDKDHASHNLYLTILAEQGLVGFVLFIGPMVYWLLRTRRSVANMPATGLVDRRFPGMLWLGFACFVIVNNFSSMHVTFGLGLWWLTLGLIGSIVHRYSRQSARLLSDSGANR